MTAGTKNNLLVSGKALVHQGRQMVQAAERLSMPLRVDMDTADSRKAAAMFHNPIGL